MRILLQFLVAATALADQVVVRDFEGRPVPEAAVRVLLVRRNHPFSDGSELVSGVTDERGCWHFVPGAFHVSRVHVDKVGHHGVRMEGLAVPMTPSREVILPRKGEAVPLHARRARGEMPGHAFSGSVSYDFEKGDLVAPGHRGVRPDVVVRIDAEQVGWAGWRTPAEVKALLAKERNPAERATLLARNGKWQTALELSFPGEGDGIIESQYAAYALMRMPSVAPSSGYMRKAEFSGQAGLSTERGFFLRVRTVRDVAGKITSANYAKIYGAPVFSPGGFAFRYYFNPVPNDRRLEMDLERNLQKEASGAGGREQFDIQVTDP